MATAICQVCPPLYNTLGGKSILRISLHDWTSRLIQSLSSDITENTKNLANKGTVYVPVLDIVAVGGLTKLLLVCENYTWVSSNFNVKQCTVREWKWSHPLVIHSVLTWRPKKNLNQPIWQTVHSFSFFLTSCRPTCKCNRQTDSKTWLLLSCYVVCDCVTLRSTWRYYYYPIICYQVRS